MERRPSLRARLMERAGWAVPGDVEIGVLGFLDRRLDLVGAELDGIDGIHG